MKSEDEKNINLNFRKDQEINLLVKPVEEINLEKIPKKRIFSDYYGICFGFFASLCDSISLILVKKAVFFNGSETVLFR